MSEGLKEYFPNISPEVIRLNATVMRLNDTREGMKDKTGILQPAKRYKTHPERDFQDQIIELAKRTGWRVHAERPAWTNKGYRTPIQGDAGFPDIVLTKGGTLIFWEAKVKSVPTPSQKEWLELLGQVRNIIVGVVYPETWEYIVNILTK